MNGHLCPINKRSISAKQALQIGGYFCHYVHLQSLSHSAPPALILKMQNLKPNGKILNNRKTHLPKITPESIIFKYFEKKNSFLYPSVSVAAGTLQRFFFIIQPSISRHLPDRKSNGYD